MTTSDLSDCWSRPAWARGLKQWSVAKPGGNKKRWDGQEGALVNSENHKEQR